MARPEAKRVRICSTTRRRAESQALKNLLRHAKTHQVSEPVYGETRSQACQDLLDLAKASRIPRHRIILEGMQSLVKSQSLFIARPEANRARICSTTRGRAESPSIKIFSKACKDASSLKACLWRDQKPSMPRSAQPREGEQNPRQ